MNDTPKRGPQDAVALAALQIAAALDRSASALERMAGALERIVVEPAVADEPQSAAGLSASASAPAPSRVIDANAIPEGGMFDGVNVADGPTDDPVEDLLAQIEASEE